ncbi:hypothetical protein SAMN05192553_101641 [Cyclobacterium xiamenense]|jgi:hypothetical protein|uniref:Uncharacterized protein n=1 Tax=Cyclobacterium xiamenense TaxID=1297121 RepID=A0A1H6U4Z2_9BACT|nr:hypothetical protein SAMN05192553_101641 [Cyclobacterium xiamenense]
MEGFLVGLVFGVLAFSIDYPPVDCSQFIVSGSKSLFLLHFRSEQLLTWYWQHPKMTASDQV